MTSQSKEVHRGCKQSWFIIPSPPRTGLKVDGEGSKTREQRHIDKKERKAIRKAAKVAGAPLTASPLQHNIAACHANRDEQVCSHLYSAVNLHVTN